jgi:predicted AlkP superfamily phosphohydrolase/phosphomutase
MILGLDGATFHFISPMIEQGKLPTLAALKERGASGVLNSIFPPHTAAAWTTVMTGELPGAHGIFNFYGLDPSRYSRRTGPVTSEHTKGKTFFDLAGAQGMKVASIHVPMTWPAWQVNGVMFSGYPSPLGSPACAYPRSLAERFPTLNAISYTDAPEKRLKFALDHITEQTDVCETILREESPDLFMTVYQESDLAHHYLYRYYDSRSPAYTEEEHRRYGDYIHRNYAALDAALARLLAYAGPETTVFVLSDHGGTLSGPTAFHLNAWLAEKGLLTKRPERLSLTKAAYGVAKKMPDTVRAPLTKLAKRAGFNKALDSIYEVHEGAGLIDPAQTKAYRFTVCTQIEGIVLNVAGRQPEGIVQPGEEYEQLRDTLMADLRALRTPDTNEPLIYQMYKREEIFPGPYLDSLPDIILRLHPMYQVGGNFDGPLFKRLEPADLRGAWSGWHDDYGILYAAGPSIPAGQTIEDGQLVNIAPTVLRALGLAAPEWMAGKVQDGIFAEDTKETLVEVSDVPVLPSGAEDEEHTVTEEEEESIKERLRNLGYL